MLTTYALEEMGFRRIEANDPLNGCFHGLYVYEARGLALGETALDPVNSSIQGIEYSLAFGNEVNAICRLLVDDDLVDDEVVWCEQKKARAPFVIIHLGPTSFHRCTSGFLKEEDGKITTYDSFPAARQEIKEIEASVLPALLASLECWFSAGGHPVRFLPVDRAIYGISSSEGRTIHDIRFSMNAEAYGAKKLPPEEFSAVLKNAVITASTLNPRVADFLHLAFQEKDRLKKFLNFFLAIEIETHAVFKSIDHTKFLGQFVVSPSANVDQTVTAFFSDQHGKLISLKERFIWCVLCVWTHLADTDVESFKKLKKVRDDIAHGNISSLPEGAEVEAERLVIKLRSRHA